METKFFQGIQAIKWVDTENMMGKPGGFIRVFHRTKNKDYLRIPMLLNSQSNWRTSTHNNKSFCFKVSGSLNNYQGTKLQSSGFPASLEESLVLKNKSAEIEQFLDGRCIYLVGMMGCGKTTIGKVLSEALNYSFCDSDLLVEQKMGGMSVAEIFKQYGEIFFREKETETLKELSKMRRIVVSTGGGFVMRPVNWKHMESGISVWLDVPLDCLARRISAVGTNTRPLLHAESGDAYSVALKRLSALLKLRGGAYANANTRVSFEYIASRLGHVSIDNLSPTVIATEVITQLESFLQDDGFAI